MLFMYNYGYVNNQLRLLQNALISVQTTLWVSSDIMPSTNNLLVDSSHPSTEAIISSGIRERERWKRDGGALPRRSCPSKLLHPAARRGGGGRFLFQISLPTVVLLPGRVEPLIARASGGRRRMPPRRDRRRLSTQWPGNICGSLSRRPRINRLSHTPAWHRRASWPKTFGGRLGATRRSRSSTMTLGGEGFLGTLLALIEVVCRQSQPLTLTLGWWSVCSRTLYFLCWGCWSAQKRPLRGL